MDRKATLNLALLLSALAVATVQAWQFWEVVFPMFLGCILDSWFLERVFNAMMASCVALIARRFLQRDVTVWPAVAIFAGTIGGIFAAGRIHRLIYTVGFLLVTHLVILTWFLVRDGTSLLSSIPRFRLARTE